VHRHRGGRIIISGIEKPGIPGSGPDSLRRSSARIVHDAHAAGQLAVRALSARAVNQQSRQDRATLANASLPPPG
jgi:hypothetical protein